MDEIGVLAERNGGGWFAAELNLFSRCRRPSVLEEHGSRTRSLGLLLPLIWL